MRSDEEAAESEKALDVGVKMLGGEDLPDFGVDVGKDEGFCSLKLAGGDLYDGSVWQCGREDFNLKRPHGRSVRLLPQKERRQ